ncbi:MAG: hypothetical protein CBC01_01775 [Betaproteobacteria bacterium TMED41]|nr:MAG: hypothetical protein CBC01_01775 [Betaproteobacteria bacterium TMED41]
MIANKISWLVNIFKLKKIIKFFFRRNPSLAFFLKQNFYFVLPGVLDKNHFHHYSIFENRIGKKFFLFPLEGKVIAFATGPLNDKRGIGRVTKNLFSQIVKVIDFDKEFKILSSEKKRKFKKYDLSCVDVYFFSSIHWCNCSIPENSVVMVMDVIPLILEDFFPEVVVNNWKKNFQLIAKNSRKIVTLSESSARDITNFLGIKREKISVVSPGLEKTKIDKFSIVKIPNDPFVLFLGSNDFHKNAKVVIKALTTQKLKKTKVVFIGENEELISICEDLKIIDKAYFLGWLKDDAIAFVMSRASVLVFPSLYEGFGLPPLEAALLEVPSVCSRKPAMTEVLEDSALFADPNDYLEWSEQIYKLMNDPTVRAKIIKNAKATTEKFCWKNSSKKLLKILIDV